MDFHSRRRSFVILVTAMAFGWPQSAAVAEAPIVHPTSIRDAFPSGETPSNVAEMLEFQTLVQSLVKKVLPTTVAISVGQAHGSGVIVSPDGYVLTAAHVAMEPNKEARVRLHDGREVLATTLGVFRTVDAGLVKIITDPESESWPTAPMGNSRESEPGDWCFATGHPGGFQRGRQPILRVGRILDKETDAIRTDCLLIGGDSGGPLFDLGGHVIGIHSRIGNKLSVNLHVPVNAFRTSWDRLAAADAWGELPGSRPKSFIGVQGDVAASDARITKVFRGSPAMRGGIEVGDVILRFDGSRVTDFESLSELVRQRHPGDEVDVEVLRDNRIHHLTLNIGEKKGQR